MSLGFPLGLLALLAVPAVVAAYFLRRKQPPRVVSALFLWRTPDQRAEAGPRFERFSRELSLALETLALVAAALFLADARCGETAKRTHVVVVVDGSLSMQASRAGKTAADATRDAVAALVRDEGASVVTLIESGPKPRLIAGPQLDVARALSALEGWTPSQPSHDPGPAVSLAKELSTVPRQRVHFFTDGPVGEVTLPPEVQGRSVGARLENVGFLSAQRRDEAGVATVTVRVASFSDGPRTVPVRFTAPGGLVQSQQVALAAGATALVRVGMKTDATIEVTLPDDALPEDGHLTLLPAPLPTLNVSLLEGLDQSAQVTVGRALRVMEHVSLQGAPPGLVIGPPESQAGVRVGAKGAPTSFVGPFFAQKTHPLLDDVQLGGVVWTAGENPPGQPLLSAGGQVLLSEDDDGVVHFNLDLSRSNVQRSVAWPVLWGNVVRRARASKEGFPRRQVHIGEDVPLVTAAGASWSLEGPDGARRPVLGVGALTVPPLSPPGTWKLRRDGEVADTVEVLALDGHESDLRTRGAWSVDAARTDALASLSDERPRAWAFLAAMLAALLADFWLTARRRT
ncbi:MAG: BatA and WFA domain-containing protein [Myxococcaceae bacterium]|nr:BatA and WFA domain-containing protein [Myxococcaceae bacterium]